MIHGKDMEKGSSSTIRTIMLVQKDLEWKDGRNEIWVRPSTNFALKHSPY